MVLKCNAKVLSSIPMCEKAMMCLMKKKYALDKLSDMNYSALGHKFHVINSKVHLEKGRKNLPICT